MPVPVPYERTHAFGDFSAVNPQLPAPGQWHDSEFDQIAGKISEILDRAQLIQRDDGALRNESVGADQLAPDAIEALLANLDTTGITGAPGPAGPAIPGPAGAVGPQAPGLNWIVSTGVPSQAIGILGQCYLNASNGDVYQKGEQGWVQTGNLKGPAGSGGGGGGVSDHGALTGLSDPDHPISAVQGLQTTLDDLTSAIALVSLQNRKVFRQSTPPTGALNPGDVWFNTAQGNRMFYWDGSSWIDVQDQAISQAQAQAASAIAAAAGAQAAADGKVTTYFGTSAPASPAPGDLWFRSDQGNRVYRWNNSAWVLVQDAAIGAAIAAANDAQATADGKIESFFSPSPPVVASIGDLWFNTADANHQYRYNGAQWISVRDAGVTAALQQAANAIQASASAQATADGKIDVFYQASAPSVGLGVGDLWIRTADKVLHRWSGSSWVVVQDAGIATALNNAALAQAAADGKITAFFQASPPSGASTDDLWYDTDDVNRPYRFNGTQWVDITNIAGVQNGLITGISILDGTITAPKLAVNSVEAQHIKAGAVDVTKLAVLSANGVTINMQGGVIVFDSGTHIFALGAGFGTNSQFVRWFGPRPTGGNVALCTEAAALEYSTTGGSGYFGGSLTGGVIRVAMQTTLDSPTAEVQAGPFLTNGEPKQITFSFRWHRNHRANAGTSSITAQGSATVVLERSLNGSSWTTIATMNLTGSGNVYIDGDPGVKDIVNYEIIGSQTVTDNTTATNSLYLRVRVTARTLPTIAGSGVSDLVMFQNTGFVSIEEP